MTNPPAPLHVGRRQPCTGETGGHWDTGKEKSTVTLPPAQPKASHLLTRGQRGQVTQVHPCVQTHAGLQQEAGSAALTPWGSDEFPPLFPQWDQGWLTPLPTSDLLHLLWAFTLWGQGQRGHFCASDACYSKMLDSVELPTSANSSSSRPAIFSLGTVFGRPLARLCLTDRASVTLLLYF